MIGYELFQRLFLSLNDLEKRNILMHVFLMRFISVYSVSFFSSYILIRIYEEHVYYQISFLYEYSVDGDSISLYSDDHLVVCSVYLFDYIGCFNAEQCSFLYFVQLLLSQDLDEVIHMFHHLL